MSSLQYYIDEFYSPAQPEMILNRLEFKLNQQSISMRATRLYQTAAPTEVSKDQDLTALAFKAIRENKVACYVHVDASNPKYERRESQFLYCSYKEQLPFDKEEVKKRIKGTGNKFFIKSIEGEYFGDDLKESYEFAIKEYDKYCRPIYVYNLETNSVLKTDHVRVYEDTPKNKDDVPVVLVKFSCTYKKRWNFS